ncbi:flagellar biosynthesis repressor FlbT [Parvularcula dongshanensis]|uniref:Flagellar protein FlbT n=1 Tax=Parvularcula dongshanensis TaxID=1173995 RepID=A0A840I6L2_9PROT|nr:flagellar biosynthesis repressor FlbT [Parvularcula dongshanensis]MBB4659640.1 flagellar protein FlbT [Parvularcula dongshanensis]
MGRLTLTLRPNERFLVGGCLVENGPKRSAITVMDEGTFVLRLSDALHPNAVKTPVRRAYYAAQLILANECSPEDGKAALEVQLAALADVFAGTPHIEDVDRAAAFASAGRFHGVLMALKPLFTVEDEMLGCDSEERKAIASR